MNEQKEREDRIAVLIDFENIGLNTIQKLFEQLADFGKISLKRAYSDWSKANKSNDQILELGIDAIHVLKSAEKGKNACDIRLTVDAIELLFTTPIDTFVIVSSDSDFIPLINKLRSSGKKVFGAGDKNKVLKKLPISCDQYFYLEQNNNVSIVGNDLEKKLKKNSNTTKTEKKVQTTGNPGIDELLGREIDQAWSEITVANGKPIPGPKAVEVVVKILKIEKLKSSPYKSLQGVLGASPLLTEHWSRDKNTIIRK
jgi:uncharacterized protein (TIGR00288 family)